MSDNTNQFFRNWRLIGDPRSVYHKAINVEIVPQSYSDKKKRTWFNYRKRKGYKSIPLRLEGELTKYESWLITHTKTIRRWDANNRECIRYFYLVNPSQSLVTILFAKCDCNWDVLDVCQVTYEDVNGVQKTEFPVCPNAPQEFFVTDFVRWMPRPLNSSWDIIWENWVQINYLRSSDVPPEWRFWWDQTFTWEEQIQVGDYVYVNQSRNQTEDGYCWQVRQVLWWDENAGDDNYLKVSSPWLWFAPGQEEWWGLTFSVFPEWGDVVGFYTRDWLYLIHYADTDTCASFTTLVCDYGTSFTWVPTCASSIVEHEWRVNILFENWYNAFWQLTFNKFYFTTDQQTYLWPDKFTVASFRNFLVAFWEKTASVTVFSNNVSQTYELVTNIGLFSSRSFAQFDNSFYFIGNDKRIHPLSIKADGNTYIMDLDDQGMSNDIKWELDLIQDTDEVYLQSDGRKLFIFINWSNGVFSGRNTKTCILIFDRDYNQWIEHHICCAAIRWEDDWYFYWDAIYLCCGNQDCQGQYFTAKVTAFIGDEENNGMDFTVFRRKKLNRAKVALGKWIYTNQNTVFTITAYSWPYKRSYTVDDIESVKWIHLNNLIAMGQDLEPDECIKNAMIDCAKFDRPCPDSARYNQDTRPVDCGCPDEPIPRDTYCNCYDDKAYFLNDVFVLKLPLQEMPYAELYRIEIESKWGDDLVFGGIIAWLYQEERDKWDVDEQDIRENEDCCAASLAKGKWCS
jgi:hypothetical protein